MKKHLLFLFAALLPLVASAQVEIHGIFYSLNKNNKTAEVFSLGSKKDATSINIPLSVTYENKSYQVTSIGRSAFKGCTSLTKVFISTSVESIGSSAFSGCTSLTTITIPTSVKTIGSSAFSGCTSLATVPIPYNALLKSIGSCAFRDCSSLATITLPVAVESIGDGAFSGCSRLTYIDLPESVTSIGNLAFSGCTSLTYIAIPYGVTSIGDDAFEGCSSLTAITLPESVTWIGSSAFEGCSSLTDVYCHTEMVPWINTDAFYYSNIQQATLHVPANAIESYKSTTLWSDFGTIVALTDEEASIENSELTIQNSQFIYDLHGRRVAPPTKDGIYIVDGKKVMVKTGM